MVGSLKLGCANNQMYKIYEHIMLYMAMIKMSLCYPGRMYTEVV